MREADTRSLPAGSGALVAGETGASGFRGSRDAIAFGEYGGWSSGGRDVIRHGVNVVPS